MLLFTGRGPLSYAVIGLPGRPVDSDDGFGSNPQGGQNSEAIRPGLLSL